MNKILLTIATAMALTSLSSAYAGPQVVGDAKSDTVHIKASEGYRMPPQEFDDYAYNYYLSNDDTIKFSRRGVAHFYAQVRGDSKAEMFAVAPGVFMTAAGSKIEFHDDGFSVVISNYERLSLANVLPVGTTVVAGR